VWHRPAAAHRERPSTDLSSLMSPRVPSRIVRDLPISGPQPPNSRLAQGRIGGRPDSSLQAPIDASRKPSHRQVQLKYLKFK
jgi:hypothetical protein